MDNQKGTVKDFSEIEKEEGNILIGGLIAPPPAGYHHHKNERGEIIGTNENFITVERYRQAKDAGFDFLEGHAETGFKSQDVRNALDSALAAGMKYMVNGDLLNFYNSTPERIKTVLGDILEHEGCFGFFAVDEPLANRYPTLAALWSRFKLATDKVMEINLLPYSPNDVPDYGVPTYEDYIEEFCKQIDTDYISIDIYPFFERENPDGTKTYSMYENWLYNLEVVENCAVRYNRKHWECVQGQKVHAISKKPDYNDIRMQLYTSMAYGAQTFQYYCYWTPEEVERPCLIDKTGNPTSIYYDAKKANHEIKKFGNVFVHFAQGWKGVMPVGDCVAFGRLKTPLRNYARIKSVFASENALVGVFNDGEGRDAFMITNYTVPGEMAVNRVKIAFKDATSAICYIGGEKTVKPLDNGNLTLDLGPGEGVFVIPEK